MCGGIYLMNNACNEITDLISIIMPAYNCEKYIDEAIGSVCNQSYSNWELIIINDASNDKTVNIAEKYVNERENVYLINNDEKSGPAKSRNKGIEMAKGRFICFLDSDDFMLPDKLSKQTEFSLKNGYGFTYTNYSRINENGEIVKERMSLIPESDWKDIACVMPMLLSTVMFDLSVIDKREIYMPDITTSEDRACFSAVLKNNMGKCDKAYLLDEVLTLYRVTKSSLSHSKINNAKSVWYYFRKIEKKSFFVSCGWFIKYVFSAVKKRK